MEHTLPVLAHIQLKNGVVDDPEKVITRRLSDMPTHYGDQNAVQMLLDDDPVIYRVYMPKQPSEAIGLYTASSVIEAGSVGEEYFMTKGHFHEDLSAPEIYMTLQGHGMLLMQTHDGQVEAHEMEPGNVSYIPGDWAHRTINIGEEPLVFFAIWPIEAGHNYESIEESGFLRQVLKGVDGPVLVKETD
jgi:glucose-6-phosphate isomerase